MGTSANRIRRVGLVLTGGTIASEHGGGPALAVSGNGPREREIGLLEAAAGQDETLEIEVRSPVRLLSENLEPSDWVAIAEAVRELTGTEGGEGVLVLHGTDTMAYTAAALSYLLADLEAPIVLTGSNLPPDQEGSDAIRNLQVSLVALSSLGPGTYIAFAGAPGLPGLVHLGTRVRKLRASGQAYASVNSKPVGWVEGNEFVATGGGTPRRPDGGAFRSQVDPRVLALRLHPGIDLEAAFDGIVAAGVRGVVVELYASATGPDRDDGYSLPDFIRRCEDRGVPVLTTVGAAPSEEGNAYETTVAISEAGGAFLAGMLPETATVKLMWALAQHRDPDQVKRLMKTPIAGDMP